MIYRTIDLCAGIGGIRRGFELTGKFTNVLSAEIDECACKTYEHLFKENPKNDLTSEAFKELVVQTDYAGLLTPVVIKGRGAKYRARVAPGTEVAIEE